MFCLTLFKAAGSKWLFSLHVITYLQQAIQQGNLRGVGNDCPDVYILNMKNCCDGTKIFVSLTFNQYFIDFIRHKVNERQKLILKIRFYYPENN